MKKSVGILFFALAAGLIAFCAMRWHKAAEFPHGEGIALDAMPELTWLRKELNLSEAQFVKVRDLHAAYRPKCTEMCRRISEAHEKIERFCVSAPSDHPRVQGRSQRTRRHPCGMPRGDAQSSLRNSRYPESRAVEALPRNDVAFCAGFYSQ